MQLHRKTLWLFVGVGLIPLLILGFSTFQRTSELLERDARMRSAAEARAVSELLALEAASADAVLGLLASTISRDSLSDPAFLSALVPSVRDETPAIRSIRLLDATGAVLAESAGAPADDSRCTADGYAALVSVSEPLPGERRLEGTYWAGGTLSSDVRERATVRDREGRILLAGECGTRPSDAPEGSVGTSAPTSGDGGRHVSVAEVEGPGWTVVVASGPTGLSTDLVTPWYLLPLALLAVLVFLATVTVRRATEPLEHLISAARSVGQGDLRPWLPPPGADEVGRLSLQFSEMTSQLREKMEQVDRSGRLAMIGKLSSYLAHEIRNPLSAVKMNLQRLERWARAGEIPARCLKPVRVSLGEVDRLSAAVSNVLQLSSHHDQPPETISAHELVREAGLLLDKEFARRGVALRWKLDAEADRVLGQPGQLKGVVLNLMLNALDAQPDGGELLILSRLAPGTSGPSTPHLELRFRDYGTGVPGDIRDRIFEPFFTTKETGSGIGLAVASQTVRDHGGDLRLEEPRRLGAEFVVSLPLAAMAPESPPVVNGRRLAPWMEEGPRDDDLPHDAPPATEG